jgi:hypothetical protein
VSAGQAMQAANVLPILRPWLLDSRGTGEGQT